MKYYVHKANIVTVQEAGENGFIECALGKIPCDKDDLIVQGYDEVQYAATKEQLENDYIEIEIKHKQKKKRKIDYEDMAKAYEELVFLNQEEDQIYLDGTYKIANNKA